MNKINESIDTILNKIPNQSFKIIKTLKSDFFSGNFIVENKKLSGRIEDIKIIETFDPLQKEEFKNEAKILSMINHDNIPIIYDLLEYKNYVLFRTKHIEGYSLREIIDFLRKKDKYLQQKIIFKIIEPISKALFYVHNNLIYDGEKTPIIHCDIKPENIIIEIKNKKRKEFFDEEELNLFNTKNIKPYLIDFGIAKFKEKIDFQKGTINYMSIEQLDKRNITWKTDAYQLSLLTYELKTNKKPFEGIERNRIIISKLNEDFETYYKKDEKLFDLNSLKKINVKKKIQKEDKKINKTKIERIEKIKKEKRNKEKIENKKKEKEKKSMKKLKIINKYTSINFQKNSIINCKNKKINKINNNGNNNNKIITEKEFLKNIEKIKRNEEIKSFFTEHKKFFFKIIVLLIILLLLIISYKICNEKIFSTYAILTRIEKKENININELEKYLSIIIQRNLRLKYIEPLKENKFKDIKTHELLYPSHLNLDGEWSFVSTDSANMGGLIAILSLYQNKDKIVNKELKKYTDIVLKLNDYNLGYMKFFYSLKEIYEKTNEEKYLNKILNLSEEILKNIEEQKGLSRIEDSYYLEIFLWIYEKTNNEIFLNNSIKIAKNILENNLDENGFLFLYSQINFTTPYGQKIEDLKMNRAIIDFENYKFSELIIIPLEKENYYKNLTSITSRDYIHLMINIRKIFNLTNDNYYFEKLKIMENYYIDNSFLHDKFLLTKQSIEKNPIDNLALIMSIKYFKNYNDEIYKEKLKLLLNKENFRNENENGIIKNVVMLKGNLFNPNDNFSNSQSTIIGDLEFLSFFN
ncbi:MAG: protein kinase [Candidatus Nanoarchaeia archaeon]|nr:protein kinase [Candidatus Nanoarchaeia archaeon]